MGEKLEKGMLRLPQLGDIGDRCAVPAVSVVAVHEGKKVIDEHAGFRKLDDAGKPVDKPDSETLYGLSSISKCFVTAAFCILVHEGKIKWTDSVKKYLKSFEPEDDPSVADATFDEVLRHSSGIDNPVVTWLGPKGKVLISNAKEDFIELLNATPTRRNGGSLRGRYVYSNVAYGLVVLVIEEVSGISFADFVQSRILSPLNMVNTAVTISQVESQKANNNIAGTHAKMSDGTWVPTEPEWTNENNGPIVGMLGMRSSATDLLVFFSALLEAYVSTASEQSKASLGAHQWSRNPFELLNGIETNPLKNVKAMLDGPYCRSPCDCDWDEDHAVYHHVPFVRTWLPCNKITWSSYNMNIANHPITKDTLNPIQDLLGQIEGNKLAYHFNGIGVCGTTAVKFFPETRTIVVAFSSGLNAGDAAEFASLLATQKIFDIKPQRDIINLVDDEVRCRLNHFENLMKDVKHHKSTLQPGARLDDFVGVYAGLGIKLVISATDDGKNLELSFNYKRDLVLRLEPYGEDQFSYWPKSRDQWVKEGWLDWDHYEVALISFRRSQQENNRVTKAAWVWENTGGPAIFERIPEDVTSGQRKEEIAPKASICPMM